MRLVKRDPKERERGALAAGRAREKAGWWEESIAPGQSHFGKLGVRGAGKSK